MFLASRELVFARGRFTLMGIVIALIAVLVVLLSGLSSGLVNDGVSGLKSMKATSFAFDKGTITDNAFSRSLVDDEQIAVWQDADGIVVSETARTEQGLELGDVITLDRLGVELEVIGFTDGQATFGHVDVAYLPIDTWRLIASNAALPGEPTAEQVEALDFEFASVVAVYAPDLALEDLEAIDEDADTMSMTRTEAFNASPGYEAETLTLSMIQVFLYVICALVVGAFFTVWTVQRKSEIAILRAVGASRGYLLRDSLAQAAILLVGFTAIGVAIGVGLGAMMPDAMPFDLEFGPILIASVLTIALGLIGAMLAVLRITRVDPLNALGGQR